MLSLEGRYQPGNSPPQSRNNGDLESAQETLQRKSGTCHFISNDKLPHQAPAPLPLRAQWVPPRPHTSQQPCARRRQQTLPGSSFSGGHLCQVGNRLTSITQGKQVQSASVRISTLHCFSPAQALSRRESSDARQGKGQGAGRSAARDDAALPQVPLGFSSCCRRRFSLFPTHL